MAESAMSEDPTMTRITAAIAQSHSGDRAGARRSFVEIWSDMGDAPDPFHVCTLAHYMADVQDEVAQELEWDVRALKAASQVTDERAKQHHASLSIRSFFPSLHLNVGDAYFRLGDLENAREHLRSARSCLGDLPDSPLADITRKGIEGLAQRLESVGR
jgi:hypothetical protein